MSEQALAIQSNVQVDTDNSGGVPYATFVSSKSPKFGEYAAIIPGLQEPDVLLIQPNDTPVKLVNPVGFLVTAKQYWADIEENGTINRVAYEDDRSDPKMREGVDAVMLFVHESGLVPARVTFRTTKCNAVKTAAKTLQTIEQKPEDWFKRSPEHAATREIPYPWARFSFGIYCVPKTARTSLRKYFLSQAIIKPANVQLIKLLAESMQDEAWKKRFIAVQDSYNRRLEDLQAHA